MLCSAAGIALTAKHPVRSTPLLMQWPELGAPNIAFAACYCSATARRFAGPALQEGSALPVGHAHAMRPAGRTAGLLALLLGLACLVGRAAAMGREC